MDAVKFPCDWRSLSKEPLASPSVGKPEMLPEEATLCVLVRVPKGVGPFRPDCLESSNRFWEDLARFFCCGAGLFFGRF